MLMVLLAFTKFCWNVPARHDEQAVLPGSDDRPRGQFEHLIAAVELYVPAGHGVHILLELAPTTELALPAGHMLHVAFDVAPRAFEYFPASHGMQLSLANWPSDKPKRPNGHASQDEKPFLLWYMPMLQFWQIVALACEILPAGQGRHSKSSGWIPAIEANNPALQPEHTALPFIVCSTRPVRHGLQAP